MFSLAFAVLVTLNLGYIPLQWDEVNHFNGALLLMRDQLWQYAATNSFYPPLYNLATTAYFMLAGASMLVGRLVTVTFSVLCIVLVFRVAKEMYGEKTGVASAVLFGVMPGFVWLSGMALIETMLIFAFTLCMLFFFRWLQTSRERDLALSLATLIIGVAVKFQILVVAPVIMIAYVFVLGRMSFLKSQTDSFVHSKRLWVGVALVAAAIALLFALYVSGLLSVWIYALQVGNPGQAWYSNRFPTPIFYVFEMVYPYSDKHPVSLLLYGLGLAGLAFFAYRRKPEDKLWLVWFFAVFAVFTLIPNRQWRYVTPLFPVLAISAAALATSTAGWMQKIWRSANSSLNRKRFAKLSAAMLIAFTATGVLYSCMDAYTWAGQGQPQLPIQQTTEYAATITGANQSIMVLSAHNLFNRDMVWFYLNAKAPSQTHVYQYPELAADAYPPNFNSTELVQLCESNSIKTLLLYEYGGTIRYFDSNLTEQGVLNLLSGTERFTLLASFGQSPDRILVLTFE